MTSTYRAAEEHDLAELIAMLGDDELGQTREDLSHPINTKYIDAFAAISKDANNELIIVELDGSIAGMLQLTFIPYLTHIGSWRCLIEGVRIHKIFRGKGLGSEMIKWSIDRAKTRGCTLVQLTSDKQRLDAIRFYENLGFTATHEGFKLKF